MGQKISSGHGMTMLQALGIEVGNSGWVSLQVETNMLLTLEIEHPCSANSVW